MTEVENKNIICSQCKKQNLESLPIGVWCYDCHEYVTIGVIKGLGEVK